MDTKQFTGYVAELNLPALVELYNEQVATARDLGVESLGGRPLREVTRFETRGRGKQRCLTLHLKVCRARAFLAREEVENPRPATAKDLDAPVVVEFVAAKPAPVAPASKARRPRYTMDSTIHKARRCPYEDGTSAAAEWHATPEGETVRVFCARHGQYPRGLNFLTPMIRDAAVEVRS